MNHAVDRIASRQHSLITTAQLRSGLSRRQVDEFHRRGALEQLRHGVYRLAGGPVNWAQTIHAAVLAAGPDAVVSHTTAAALWEFRHAGRDRARLHLTARHRVRLAGVMPHLSALGTGDTAVCQGVPATSPERTLMDLAATLTAKQLGECLDDALRRRLINLEKLRRLVIAASAGRGRRLLCRFMNFWLSAYPAITPEVATGNKRRTASGTASGSNPASGSSE